MPFVIEWIKICEGREQKVKIQMPVAKLVLTFRGDVITGTEWKPDDCVDPVGEHPLQKKIDELWMGSGKTVKVKLLKQGTEYRNRVWGELCEIPLGETVSYSWLARKIGSAPRAVGNACRDNPYAFIIPCHRVVSVGGIGGYCGQTKGNFIDIKTRLLQFEAAFKS